MLFCLMVIRFPTCSSKGRKDLGEMQEREGKSFGEIKNRYRMGFGTGRKLIIFIRGLVRKH